MRKPPIIVKMEGFIREINWAEYCDYYDGEGRIVIQFSGKIAPHLSKLEGHFTQYKLSRTTGFRSIYTWRLFELFMQFKRTGLLRINVDEFADTMEATPAHRKDFGAMRRRVIEPALKEIKEKDGLEVNWSTQKKGRKVIGLEFTFPSEQQQALPLKPPKVTKSAKSSNPPPRSTYKEEMSQRQKQAEQQGLERLAALAERVEVLTEEEPK